jgi:tetratricopeptide (TPR) repeat protein
MSPIPPSRLNSGVDPALDRIISRCLNRDSKDRFSSFAEFFQTLLKQSSLWLENVPEDSRLVPDPNHVIAVDHFGLQLPDGLNATFMLDYVVAATALATNPRKVVVDDKHPFRAPDGSDWVSYFQRVHVLMEIHNYEAAAGLIAEALDSDSENPLALSYQAILLGALGKHEKAIEAYDKVFALEHNHPWCKVPAMAYNAAITYYVRAVDLERAKGARGAFERRVANETDREYRLHLHETVSSAIEFLEVNISMLCADILAPEEATAIQTTKSFIKAKRAFGLIYAGRFSEALPLLRHAVVVDPDNGAIWGVLGDCYMELGRLEEAEQALRHSCTHSPDNFQSWFHRAQVCLRLGRADDLEECLITAWQLQPENEQLNELISNLIAEDLKRF